MEKPALTPELKVLNFQESLNFYTKLAGFEVLYDRPENEFAMLGINGARLMIEGLTDKSRTWAVGNLERPFGRDKIEFENYTHLKPYDELSINTNLDFPFYATWKKLVVDHGQKDWLIKQKEF